MSHAYIDFQTRQIITSIAANDCKSRAGPIELTARSACRSEQTARLGACHSNAQLEATSQPSQPARQTAARCARFTSLCLNLSLRVSARASQLANGIIHLPVYSWKRNVRACQYNTHGLHWRWIHPVVIWVIGDQPMGGWCDPQSAEHISLGAIMQSDTANALMYTAPSTFIHGLSLSVPRSRSLSLLCVLYICMQGVCVPSQPTTPGRPPVLTASPRWFMAIVLYYAP